MTDIRNKSYNQPRNITRRLKLGLRRTVRQWNPFLHYKYRKSILHNRRVFKATPDILNIIIFISGVIFISIQMIDKNFFSSNPIIFILGLLYLIILIFITIWYAGSDEYLKYRP